MLSFNHRRCLVVSTLMGMGCLMATSRIQADDIPWQKDFQQATKQAAQQDKPLMVMVSAPWCGYCQKMLQTTFRDETLTEHLKERVIPVYLDADENKELLEQFQVDGLPTMLIVSADVKVIERLTGYQSAEALNGQVAKLGDDSKENKPAPALAEKPPAPAPTFNGTCLVSLRDDGQVTQGTAKWSSTHKGQRLWFASAEHKRQFDRRPESYWPMADGICLVSQRLERLSRPGVPALAMIYADRLWFFADEARQREFAQNPRPYAAQAERIASKR